jgi:excisionase family DNA binding protein
MKIAYSVKEACAALGVGKDRLYQAMAAGQLKGKRLGGRTLIPAEELQRWFNGKPDYVPRVLPAHEKRRAAKREREAATA